MHAPSAFYDVTPVGRVLNRFTKDLNDLDVQMPRYMQSSINMLFMILGSLVATAVVTPIFVAVIFVCGILFIALQRYYAASTVQMKRVESVTRSPVYNHFGETIAGTSTIRAFGKQAEFCEENNKNINRTAQAFFLVRCVLQWATIRIGTLNALLLFSAAIFTALQKKSGVSPGDAAVAIMCVLQIGPLFGFLINNLTELDNMMNSVERIQDYSTSIQSEPEWEKDQVEVPADWPSKGTIEFKDVVFRYRKDLDPVLKGLSASIAEEEVVGVAGRTGSGKSSLMLTLFRMYEIDSGTISIDGIDISKIGLHTLRKKLGIIPQDPVIFSGTIASNLDPFEEFTDQDKWDALSHVQLKHFVEEFQGKLEGALTEGGGNLSAGQRQLLCIARAILRKPKILVMDEATSSVDSHTDALIQKTVTTQFTNCTRLTIAHRLNTIMDSKRIMVLEQGNLVEFDEPWPLTEKKGGTFAGMYQAMTQSHASN